MKTYQITVIVTSDDPLAATEVRNEILSSLDSSDLRCAYQVGKPVELPPNRNVHPVFQNVLGQLCAKS